MKINDEINIDIYFFPSCSVFFYLFAVGLILPRKAEELIIDIEGLALTRKSLLRRFIKFFNCMMQFKIMMHK